MEINDRHSYAHTFSMAIVWAFISRIIPLRRIGQPESFEIDDNPLDVEELREEIQTFPPEITDKNFKLWSCISILTDDEKWSFI